MKSGVIDLKPIFEFVKTHKEVPAGRRGFRKYSRACEDLLRHVPEQSGWYFWGRIDRGDWKHVYIGMAGYRKRKLCSRIKEELKDERVAFWADVWGEEYTRENHERQYRGKYKWEVARALQKRGTKYIIWVADELASPREIKDEENMLIQKLNPSANRDHRGKKEETRKTRLIKNLFEEQVEKLK